MTTEPALYAPGTATAAGDGGGGGGGGDSSMSTLPRVGKRGAPQAFARKLFEILTTEPQSVIAWNKDGTAFHVKEVESFSEEILTKYYRHSKFSSFQRQLNLYSFRKIVKGPDAGGYAHPMFRRDRPDDLYHVRRSISGSAKYEPAAHAAASNAAAAKTTASATRRSAGRASLKAKGGVEWAPPRAHKSSAASRRVGKLRGGPPAASSAAPSVPSSARRADHHQLLTAPAGATVAPPSTADMSAGERSPWTSGESSDSDVGVDEISLEESSSSGVDDSDSELPEINEGERRSSSNSSSSSSSSRREGHERRGASGANAAATGGIMRQGDASPSSAGDGARREQQQKGQRFSCATAAANAGDGSSRTRGGSANAELGRAVRSEAGASRAGGSQGSTRTSPFNFFKKTFSFMERSSSHSRGLSTSSVDMTPSEPAAPPASTADADADADAVDVSHLMVDTSAAARAAAAGTNLNRPPPVTVTGGRLPVDPTTAAGSKVLTSSPLTPKSSTEAAAVAAAAAAAAAAASAAMPPPPKREQREELGLVEQLTNMVEVFDICDLLRKVSTSGSSRLDKHGGIVKPLSSSSSHQQFQQQQQQQQQQQMLQPQHTRNMSVDTDQGLPQSPQSRDGGLGSLASMELVRDSSRDWDTLIAGSADVSDLGNTMVQSVAEFFSF